MHTKLLLSTINNVLNEADGFEELSNLIFKCDRIFIAGAGRSGLVSKFFGMRLVHLGKIVYIVGETTTPAIIEDDLLIVISGSGGTPTMIEFAKKARNKGARVVSISSNIDSPLGILSDHIYKIGGESPTSGDINIFPMGTIFELSSLIFLESVISTIIYNNNILENDMKDRHTILE